VDLTCPFCKSSNPAEAPACGACSARLVKRCPYCAEEIQILAGICPCCASDLGAGGLDAPAIARPRRGFAEVGFEEAVLMDLALSLVTFGLYGSYVIYRIGRDLNYHAGRAALSPEIDAVLYLATCGLWAVYVAWHYTSFLNDVERREGVPASDIMSLCVVLSIVNLGWISMLVIQDQLNRHWRLHGRASARAD
jgi:hypothetical protein